MVCRDYGLTKRIKEAVLPQGFGAGGDEARLRVRNTFFDCTDTPDLVLRRQSSEPALVLRKSDHHIETPWVSTSPAAEHVTQAQTTDDKQSEAGDSDIIIEAKMDLHDLEEERADYQESAVFECPSTPDSEVNFGTQSRACTSRAASNGDDEDEDEEEALETSDGQRAFATLHPQFMPRAYSSAADFIDSGVPRTMPDAILDGPSSSSMPNYLGGLLPSQSPSPPEGCHSEGLPTKLSPFRSKVQEEARDGASTADTVGGRGGAADVHRGSSSVLGGTTSLGPLAAQLQQRLLLPGVKGSGIHSSPLPEPQHAHPAVHSTHSLPLHATAAATGPATGGAGATALAGSPVVQTLPFGLVWVPLVAQTAAPPGTQAATMASSGGRSSPVDTSRRESPASSAQDSDRTGKADRGAVRGHRARKNTRLARATVIAQLQEHLQSAENTSRFKYPPGVRILQWSYRQRTDGRLMFCGVLSFLCNGVPHHVVGDWQPCKKFARQSTADAALAFVRGANLETSGGAPVDVCVDLSSILPAQSSEAGRSRASGRHVQKLVAFLRREHPDAEFSHLTWQSAPFPEGCATSVTFQVHGVVRTFYGPTLKTFEAASSELARRITWYLGCATCRNFYRPPRAALIAAHCEVPAAPALWSAGRLGVDVEDEESCGSSPCSAGASNQAASGW